MKTFSKQIWHQKLLAPWWLGSGKSISWDRSHRSKEEHTLNSMKNKWVLRGRDESSYLWLQTLGYTPKFEVALVNACQAQRKIKHSITKCMGAYAILFKVLPCHSDRWFSILPKTAKQAQNDSRSPTHHRMHKNTQHLRCTGTHHNKMDSTSFPY